MDTSPSKYSVNGNTLTISNINKSDEGLYRCVYELGQTKELCLFVYGEFIHIYIYFLSTLCFDFLGSAVFASCPLDLGGCAGDPVPLSAASGGNVSFNATIIHTPSGSCGFKQEISRVILRKIQFSNELLLSCATSQTACSSNTGRVFLNRGMDSSSELSFVFNSLRDSDSGLYEVVIEGTHPSTGSLTTISKRFQLEGNNSIVTVLSPLLMPLIILQ